MKTPKVLALSVLTFLVGLGLGTWLHPPLGFGPFAWIQYGHNPHRHAVIHATFSHPESWTYTINQGGLASPASVVDGIVFAASNGNRVAAIKNGRRLWQVRVRNMVMTTPLLTGNAVIVGLGNKAFASTHIRGTGWSGVMALKATTGATLWSQKTQGAVMPTPAIANNRVYAATGAGHVLVLNVATGHVIHSIGLKGSYVSMSSPLVIGHGLYVGGALPYALYGINLTTDHMAWALPVPAQGGLDDCSPVWADGIIATQYTTYLAKNSPTMKAVMIGVTPKGHLRWKTDLGLGQTAADEMQTGQPTVVGTTVYVGSPVTDKVYAINSQTGHILWSTDVGAAVRGNPAILAGAVLVGDSQGRIDTLSIKTGNLLKKISVTPGTAGNSTTTNPTPTGFSGAGPVIYGSTLYIVSMNGTVLARPVGQFLLGGRASRTTS